MLRRACALSLGLVGAFWVAGAAAHGGGGGGGGHGGHTTTVYSGYYVGGAAAAPVVPAAQPGDYSSIHRVALVSVIGDTLQLMDSPTATNYTPANISAWGIDAQVETLMNRYLGGRFSFSHVDFDRASIESLKNDKTVSGDGGLNDKLAALKADGVDAFIVVRPDVEGGMMGPQGLALANPNGIFIRPIIFANYEIDVIDAHNFARIGHASSRMLMRDGGAPYEFPLTFGQPGSSFISGMTLTPGQSVSIHRDLSKLVTDSVVGTIRSLQFGVTLPDPAARTLVPIADDKKRLPKARTVAVVSAIGDTIQLDHRAIFSSSTNNASIAAWNLDNEVEAMVAAALDKRFTVKTVAGVDRAQLMAINMHVSQSALTTPLAGLPTDAPVDAYILILKDWSVPGQNGGPASAIHLENASSLAGEYNSLAAGYLIAFVDAKSLTPVWVQRGVASPERPNVALFTVVGKSDWPSDGATLSSDQMTALHRETDDMMKDSIGETVLLAGLSGMMEAPYTEFVPADPPPVTAAAATPPKRAPAGAKKTSK